MSPCAFLDLDERQFKSLSFSGLLDGKGGQALRLQESNGHRTVSLTGALGAGWGEAGEHFWQGWLFTERRGSAPSSTHTAGAPGPWAAGLFHLFETYLSSKAQVKCPHLRAVFLD